MRAPLAIGALLIVATAISNPTLEARAISLPPRHSQKSNGQKLLIDCERVINSVDHPDLAERCFALIDAMLHLELPTSSPSDQMARRDARSPLPARPPPFTSDALGLGMNHPSGDALGKLLTGLNEATGGEEFSLLDAGDKPIWPNTMSEGIQSRWQPMRGKRQQLHGSTD